MVASAEEAPVCRTLLSDTIAFTVTKTDVLVEKAMIMDILSRLQKLQESASVRIPPPDSAEIQKIRLYYEGAPMPEPDRLQTFVYNLGAEISAHVIVTFLANTVEIEIHPPRRFKLLDLHYYARVLKSTGFDVTFPDTINEPLFETATTQSVRSSKRPSQAPQT